MHAGDVTRTAIEAAAAVIQPYVRVTPVLDIDAADLGLAGFALALKLEQLQHGGSFKTRGAFANLLLRARVERVVLVTDAALVEAQRRLWERLRVVAEPAGAAPVAALLGGAYVPAPGQRVGVVISGGNTTAVDFGAGPGPSGAG